MIFFLTFFFFSFFKKNNRLSAKKAPAHMKHWSSEIELDLKPEILVTHSSKKDTLTCKLMLEKLKKFKLLLMISLSAITVLLDLENNKLFVNMTK